MGQTEAENGLETRHLRSSILAFAADSALQPVLVALVYFSGWLSFVVGGAATEFNCDGSDLLPEGGREHRLGTFQISSKELIQKKMQCEENLMQPASSYCN